MPPILEVSGLSYSYHTISGETKALSDISFQVETGEFIAIVGPSGCGKSTLLSLISGLLPPEEGSILINGVPLSKSQCRMLGWYIGGDAASFITGLGVLFFVLFISPIAERLIDGF